MAEISFGGLATGLPTEDIVSSLIAVKRIPIDRLEADRELQTLRFQAYEQFNTRLDTLRSAAGSLNITSEVRTTSVRLSSEEAITASSNSAATGSYDITVTSLAQVQKNASTGFSSATDALLGTGSFTINAEVITVDSSNNSLQGLMNSVNAVSEETGVTASIINDGRSSGNYHLVFTGKDAATTFTLSSDLLDEAGEPFAPQQVRAAQQAIAFIDGIEVVSNTNTITDAIAGLTINLNKTSEIITPASKNKPAVYETTSLNVETDAAALKEKLSVFVSSYNSIMEWINSGYVEQTESTDVLAEGETAEEESLSGYLRNDATINSIKQRLQSILTDSVGSSGSYQILAEIGMTTQRDGTLYLDDAKLDSALESKFDDVGKLLAGEDATEGVMKKFNAYLVETTSTASGMYSNKRENYEMLLQRLDEQILQKESLMEGIELRIRSQFNAMELLVSSLNAQSEYLTQQMDMLANLNSGN